MRTYIIKKLWILIQFIDMFCLTKLRKFTSTFMSFDTGEVHHCKLTCMLGNIADRLAGYGNAEQIFVKVFDKC